MQERVRKNTSDHINREVDKKIKESIELYSSQDSEMINKRIKQLEQEWDIERALEVNMPIVALVGLALGIFVNPWWFIFPVIVMLFFLEHAIQGWCPPLPIFRSLGFRTKEEIEKERYALKILRGDFDSLSIKNMSTNDLYKAVAKK
jgi:hypothetical protein